MRRAGRATCFTLVALLLLGAHAEARRRRPSTGDTPPPAATAQPAPSTGTAPPGSAAPSPTASAASVAAGPTAPLPAAALLAFDERALRDPSRELEAEVRAGLADRVALTPAAKVDALLRDAPDLSGCATAACLERAGRALSARFLVRGAIALSGDDYDGTLALVDAASGRTLAEEKVRCELCGWVDAREHVRAAARALGDQALAVAASSPAPPPVAAVEDRPTAAAPPRAETVGSRRARLLTALSIASGAVGLGLAAAGAVLLAKDGRCAVPAPPDAASSGGCPVLYDTKLEGALFVGAGVASAATSAVLLLVERRERRRPNGLARSTLEGMPSLVPLRGGAAASLRIAF